MFGLTGGLVPCPASVTILMICLHLRRFTFGAVMVASFSLGLAISMVSVGVIAAWGARQVGKRFGNSRFSDLDRKMPYFSSGLMALTTVFMGIQGLMQLAAINRLGCRIPCKYGVRALAAVEELNHSNLGTSQKRAPRRNVI